MSEFRRRLMMQSKADNPILKDYLTIEALEDGLTAKLSINACEYCVDGDGNWKTLPADTETEAVNSGQTLSFRGNLTPTSSNGIGTFTINKFNNLKGDCMSLLFGDNVKDCFSLSGKNYTFYNLFRNNSKVVNAAELLLIATELSTGCYQSMFYNCTSLTTAPELPATTLATKCYMYMFCGCSKLTVAPELPATTALNGCYRAMFEGCTALKTAPELPATTLATECYHSMFNSCTSLTTAPALPSITLKNNCYQNMFRSCRTLTTAPELPATTLANSCYQGMFDYCTSLIIAPILRTSVLANSCYKAMFTHCTKLNYIKMLATDISATDCLLNFTSNVAANGTFVKSKDATWDNELVVPSGWEVITE